MNYDTARAVLRQSAQWRTASYSQGENNCVEFNGSLLGLAGVRDSKQGTHGLVLVFSDTCWRGLLGHLHATH